MNNEEIMYRLYLMVQKNGGNIHIAINDLIDQSSGEEFRIIFNSMFDIADILRSNLETRLVYEKETFKDLSVSDYLNRRWVIYENFSASGKMFQMAKIYSGGSDFSEHPESTTIFPVDDGFKRISTKDAFIFRSLNGTLFAVSRSMEMNAALVVG